MSDLSPGLLDTLLELQLLDRVPRTGYLLRGLAGAESVSEHSFHVTLLVTVLASRIPGLDRARALELALVHDLAEVRLSDLPRTASRYLEPALKRRAELAAGRDLCTPLGEQIAARHREALVGESLEARFVHACDQLQMLIKVAAYERSGARGLDDFWEANDLAASEFGPIRDLCEQLTARRRARG